MITMVHCRQDYHFFSGKLSKLSAFLKYCGQHFIGKGTDFRELETGPCKLSNGFVFERNAN